MQNTCRRLLSLYHAVAFIGATLLLGAWSAGSNPSSMLGETSQPLAHLPPALMEPFSLLSSPQAKLSDL